MIRFIIFAAVLLPIHALADDRWWPLSCENAPAWSKCHVAPVPLPPAKPVEIAPVPEVVPTLTPAWPEPPRLELPKVQPKAAPPKQADRSKPKPKQKQEPREPISGGGQAAPVKGCTPLPPADCGKICSYGRSFSKATLTWMRQVAGYCEPTRQQESAGRACILRNCPDVKL